MLDVIMMFAALPVLMTGGGAVGYLLVQQLPWLPSVGRILRLVWLS